MYFFVVIWAEIKYFLEQGCQKFQEKSILTYISANLQFKKPNNNVSKSNIVNNK